jgi:hypothetical protein
MTRDVEIGGVDVVQNGLDGGRDFQSAFAINGRGIIATEHAESQKPLGIGDPSPEYHFLPLLATLLHKHTFSPLACQVFFRICLLFSDNSPEFL